jgi:hypothetical protein
MLHFFRNIELLFTKSWIFFTKFWSFKFFNFNLISFEFFLEILNFF